MAKAPQRIRVSKSVIDAKDKRIKELEELNKKAARTIVDQNARIQLMEKRFSEVENKFKELESIDAEVTAQREKTLNELEETRKVVVELQHVNEKLRNERKQPECNKLKRRGLQVSVNIIQMLHDNGIEDATQMTLEEIRHFETVLKLAFKPLQAFGV